MVLALVIVATVVLVVVAIKASEHLRHAENIHPHEQVTGTFEPNDTSSGSDRPAGADAEDPTTTLPNRSDAQPPTGPA